MDRHMGSKYYFSILEILYFYIELTQSLSIHELTCHSYTSVIDETLDQHFEEYN